MQISQLSDFDLLASLKDLVQRGCSWEAELLRHLGEVDRRELHLERGYAALFTYCVEALGFDNGAAYNRIAVARLGRRLPRVVDMVASGALTLTAARTLKPHLEAISDGDGDGDVDELLDAAAGKTVDAIRVLLVERHPKPPVATTLRKLPTRKPANSQARPAPLFDAPARTAPSRKVKPEPIAKDRYKMTFTASAELVGMLEEVTALMSQASGGTCDEAQVVETAVRELRDRLRKKKYAVGARPAKARAKKGSRGTTRTRRIPNAVRREVAERDGLSCAYRDPVTGKRCQETRFLEYQHHEAFSLGGEHSAENLSLFCRAHNQWDGKRRGLIGTPPSKSCGH
jgi:hypothetical protein